MANMRGYPRLPIKREVFKIYIKSFDSNLRGYNSFQFEVGKTYETSSEDTWRWFHYSRKAKIALKYKPHKHTRFCEVMPLGKISRFSNYVTTNKLKIIREIPRREIMELLINEKCDSYYISKLSS